MENKYDIIWMALKSAPKCTDPNLLTNDLCSRYKVHGSANKSIVQYIVALACDAVGSDEKTKFLSQIFFDCFPETVKYND